MKRTLLALVVLTGCTRAGTGQGSDHSEPDPAPTKVESVPAYAPAPTPTSHTPPTTNVQKPKIELTSVTLADDCGGAVPSAPVRKAAVTRSRAQMDVSDGAAGPRGDRRCEQTSMQLESEVFTATTVKVKSVELFDETGKSLGTLTASKPRVWSATTSTYAAWNEKLAQGPATNVTYVLSQPAWATIGNRWNRTFTVKTVVTLDGTDMPLQRDVELHAESSLPPGVRT